MLTSRLLIGLAAGVGLLPVTSAVAAPFTAPTNYATANASQSVATADFNGDGLQDVAVVNQAGSVSVLVGATGGTFGGLVNYATAPGTTPVSIAIADFNGDGDPDIVTANNTSANVSVLLGGAGATFTLPATPYGAGSNPFGLATGDFNGDADPDLAVPNNTSSNVSILLGSAAGTFTGPTNFAAGSGPLAVSVGEFNGDGDPDLAIANVSGSTVSILLGAAGGTFTAAAAIATGANPAAIAIADFDGDGDADLAIVENGPDRASIWLGNNTGAFTAGTTPAVGSNPFGAATSDFNGDGDPDIAVANQGGGVSILLGAAGATFTAATAGVAGSTPVSVAIADFNGDGDPDLAVANNASNNVSILFGINPAAPSGLAVAPASPANNNSPSISGTAGAGTTVRVYTTAGCTGTPVATGTAAAFASPGLSVTVADNSTTTFRATATDADGISPCSSSSVTYREETPAPPGNDPAPTPTDPEPTPTDPDPAPTKPDPAPVPSPAPSITQLAVNRRCVRSATLTEPTPGAKGLAFEFELSQDATVRYEMLRRVNTPRWTFCPPTGGTTPVTFGSVWQSTSQHPAGHHQTSIATTASRRSSRQLRMHRGLRRLSLARVAGGQTLRPGTHLLRLVATNANGRSEQVEVKFWVLGPRPGRRR